MFSGNAFPSDSAISNFTDFDTQCYENNITTGLCYHIPQTENVVSSISKVFPISLKSPFKQFVAFTGTTEKQISIPFSQYHHYSTFVIKRFERVDIIFPFHYFL